MLFYHGQNHGQTPQKFWQTIPLLLADTIRQVAFDESVILLLDVRRKHMLLCEGKGLFRLNAITTRSRYIMVFI